MGDSLSGGGFKLYRSARYLAAMFAASTLSCGLAFADGAVYAMTNAIGANQILVYHRFADGHLSSSPVQTISTGGGGSGLQLAGIDALGSAGSLQLDSKHRFLFAVNTESASENDGSAGYNSDCRQGTITSFLVAPDGRLTFADRVSSGGLYPNSITVRDKNRGNDDQQELYVLNAGGPGTCGISPNVTGFAVNPQGRFREVRSVQNIEPGPTSGTGVNCPPIGFNPPADFQCGLNPPSFPRSPAQVRFTPDDDHLVVTVKGTSSIYVFPVGKNGNLGDPAIAQASGPGLPSFFGFTFDQAGHILVTELFGTATTIPAGNAGAVSSFRIEPNGALSLISGHVSDGGTAACWIVLDPLTQRYAYVANNLSNSISVYAVEGNGQLTLLAGMAAAASGPNDLAAVRERGASFLYALDAGDGTVSAFRIENNGSLTVLAGASGLPVNRGAQGIAAY